MVPFSILRQRSSRMVDKGLGVVAELRRSIVRIIGGTRKKGCSSMIERVKNLIRSNAEKLIGSQRLGADQQGRNATGINEKAAAALVLTACALVMIGWSILLGYGIFRLIVWVLS